MMAGFLQALNMSATLSLKVDYQSKVGRISVAIKWAATRGQQLILAQGTIRMVPSKQILPSNLSLRDTLMKFRRQKHLVNKRGKLSSSITISMHI